jgi:hypothetical protein
VKCKSFHKVDSIIVSEHSKESSKPRSLRSKPRVGDERCSFRGPKCTSTPVLYSCKLCSPASYMCRGCYSDEDKKLQALMFKTEVSLYYQFQFIINKIVTIIINRYQSHYRL